MKMEPQENKEIPPPNWSPTGNEGWWVRDSPSCPWKWVDDVYGEQSESEWRKAQEVVGRTRKPWWKRIFNKN